MTTKVMSGTELKKWIYAIKSSLRSLPTRNSIPIVDNLKCAQGINCMQDINFLQEGFNYSQIYQFQSS